MVDRKRIRNWPLAALACVSLLLFAPLARAHPAGFTSVNRYVGVQCGANGILHLDYLLDFAELPSYSEFDQLDANRDGTVTPEEQRAYLDRRLPPLLAHWVVLVNGAPAILRLLGSNLEVRTGEQGMSTLRIAAEIEAERLPPLDPGVADVEVHVSDPGFADRSGWREMAADDSADAVVVAGAKGRSAQALAYASGAGTNPPRQDNEEFTFRRTKTTPAPAASAGPARAPLVDERLARLSAALKRASGSFLFSVLALGLAAVLGAVHALSPGHGKALAAAYLVGRRARPSHALVFGLSVTAAHTAVVFLVGLLAVTLERTIGSDRLLRGLELASAATVLGLGLLQLSTRWREVVNHEGDHHHHPRIEAGASGPRAVIALGASSGLTPCPTALAVLLAAIALHRYAFGLLLVLSFSFGVAATLTAAGLLVLLARRLLERASAAEPLLRWLPLVSSACVTVIGVLLCASAWSGG